MKRMWEQHIVPYFRYCPSTCLEGLRKDTINFYQKCRSLIQYFHNTNQKCYHNFILFLFFFRESNYDYYLTD